MSIEDLKKCGTETPFFTLKGVKTYGTLGPSGDKTQLSPDALTIDGINNIVTNSGALDISVLRKRIVEVAASYVGNQEALPAQNPGWWDEDYEAKFKQLKLYPCSRTQPWCAWFCQLVLKKVVSWPFSAYLSDGISTFSNSPAI